MINDQCASRRQLDRPRVGILDLVFDLKAREQRCGILIVLQLCGVVRHHLHHETRCSLVYRALIDQDLLNIPPQMIPQGSHNQVAFLINQKRGLLTGGSFGNNPP